MAIKNLSSGDILIIAGKGHENYQEYKKNKFFSDKLEILKAINKTNLTLSKSIKTNILRENLNKKEEASAKLKYLKYTKLRQQIFMLHMTTNPDKFLDDLDEVKKQRGIKNLWKEEQYKEWREEVKKHPEKVGKLHITEDSFTFEFGDKNKKN